jgi:hypothetical protein
MSFLDRENVLSFALISLQLEADFAHPLAALARFDLVKLLALGGSFGARFLMHLLFAAKTLLFETLDNVNSATSLQRHLTGGVGLIIDIVCFEAIHTTDLKPTSARQ